MSAEPVHFIRIEEGDDLDVSSAIGTGEIEMPMLDQLRRRCLKSGRRGTLQTQCLTAALRSGCVHYDRPDCSFDRGFAREADEVTLVLG